MHIPSIALLAGAALAIATPSPSLVKRCSPAWDPDLPKGYYPPAPCWQTFDPSCTAYLASQTEQTVNAKFKSVVVFGVSEYCGAEIAEELAREKDGRKNYGWVKTHGNLDFIKGKGGENGGILVISNMTDAAVARYQRLTYLGPPWGTGPATSWQ
ncbi:hypothetical protein V8F20_003659 [Naviculisporaceae sp. PSN 640]